MAIGLHEKQKSVKQLTKNPSGFLTNWESEALEVLIRYEGRFAHQIPTLELRSRTLERLDRIKIRSREHLAALICKIAYQVRSDYLKAERRHQQHHDYSHDVTTCPDPSLTAGNELTSRLWDLLDELLGEDSPLRGSEKALLQVAFDERHTYINSDGRINQTKLAKRLGINQRNVGRRLQRIVRKAEAWKQGQLELVL